MISSLTQITQTPLINLRWLSVMAMVAAALISPSIIGSSELMPRLLAFATLVASINACMHLAILLSRSYREDLPFFSPLIQLAFDLASWGTYIYLSGGATNPLISVFLPLVAIGAFILSKAQAWFFGVAAIAAYTFLWRYYQPLAIADAEMATRLHLLGMWLVFVVSAIVVIGFVLQMTKAIHERDAELAKAREQAIRDDWLISMGSLAAGAAHELSTPLGTMNILIDDWLDDPALPAPQRAEYELMHAQIEACKQALNHLTKRAGNPRSERLGKMPFDVWLNATLAAWSTLNPTANLTVDTANNLAGRLLSVDPSMDRSLCNLLDNALFAGASRIELNARDSQGRLIIDIDDDGIGISATALQSFHDAQPIASASGMGIGLLLSRTAIERLGGKMTLARRPEGGTRASLNLPLIDDEEKTTA